MIYSESIRKAVHFAITTHEVHQQQKRKGKSIPYFGHPLTVALILARAGADEDTIVAGILHDTVEDSSPEFPVTVDTLEKLFGPTVSSLVDSVTEPPKSDEWRRRKQDALNRIATYSDKSVLIKSADVLANDWELIDDVRDEGHSVFARFNVPRDERLRHQHRMIKALLARSPDSPLAGDLASLAVTLTNLDADFPLDTPRSHEG